MPLDGEADAHHALALWRDLDAAYDSLEAGLRTQAWDDLASVAARAAAIERELAPLLARRGQSPATPAALAAWREADARAQTLSARLPAIDLAARAARDVAAAQLARARTAREQTSTYRAHPKGTPRFTSRIA